MALVNRKVSWTSEMEDQRQVILFWFCFFQPVTSFGSSAMFHQVCVLLICEGLKNPVVCTHHK